ncbi:DUF3830 family protein [Paraburkholderia xenovorans]|uniref:DUF3830 family protein n=1 Tax=Paraburkholderia xenovorans TaxID=36873 RepID=UPI0015593AF8|nr:DUF3830 family protein [Paraburkholderia xenovorans]NPT37470.1 DUF3830 family protein [Paraburkholderia xenovorans]
MNRVHMTVGEFTFVAEFHPKAPRTVAAFQRLLPYRRHLIHVRWSGEACWIPLGDNQFQAADQTPIGFENHNSHPSVGDILFYPGGYSETEIILAYGACSFSSRIGQLAGNHFLTIVEGREALPELGERVLWSGAQQILFEAMISN